MCTQYVRTIAWIMLVILVAGCGSSTITMPVSPTDTPTAPVVEPTQAVSPATELDGAGDTWIKMYGGDRDTDCRDILMADDGGYFIAGTTNLEFEPEMQGDIYLIRTDAAGQPLWAKTYGEGSYASSTSISQTDDGRLLLSGVTISSDANGMDILLLELDQDGNELWSKTFGGPLDEMGAAWPMADGGYLLGGNIVDPDDFVADPGAAGYGGFEGRSNVYLAKLDAGGNELWSRAFGGENNVLATDGIQTPDGGFLILATITYFPDSGDDIYLLKVDENGDAVWSRTWEEGTTNAYDLVQTWDGHYLITAAYAPIDDTDSSKEDCLFIKVDPEGNELWTSIFGDPDMIDYGVVLAETADGGYVAAGERTTDHYTWDADILLVKIDRNGQLLWEQILPASHTMFADILQHPDGGYVIAGSIFRDGTFDILVIKTDSDGNVSE
jgi:hypothetical protein